MIDFTTEFGQRAKQHLDDEYFIWFTTVGSNLTPQPRPVWFIWEDNSFLIFSRPDTFKVEHVKVHPNVSLHFNTDEKADENVVVFLGNAKIDNSVQPPHKIPAYLDKYRAGISDLEMTPKSFSEEYSLAIRVTPTKLRGW